MPLGSRIVFDRDYILFSGALTLGELLARIPGVFVVRGGWFGQAEQIAYAGQGGASIEIDWDGVVLDPLGEDSVGFDVSRVNLGLLRRVEVEVLPSLLRIYLVSDEQSVRRPRTETSFATGDAETNSYRIRYLNRWRPGSGLGLGVAALATDGPPSSPGDVSDLTIWAKANWSPSPRVGIEARALRYSLERQTPRPGAENIPPFLLPSLDVGRTDLVVRAHAATGEDAMGLRLDGVLGGSSYAGMGGAEDVRILQAAAILGYRAPRWSLEATARVRDVRTPFEARLRGGWAPSRWLVLSGSLRRAEHEPDRRSVEASSGAELRLARWLSFRGAVRWRDAVAAPSVLTDTAQQVTDASGGMRILAAGGRFDLDLGFERHAGFEAPAFGSFAAILPRATAIDVATVTAHLTLRPRPWLTVAGWWRHPVDPIRAAYEPPNHGRVEATFASRFLPKFRRGIFDVVLKATLEGWGGGVAGRDESGAMIPLEGATVIEYLVEIRLAGAILFWTLRNPNSEFYSVVPGLQMPRALQRWGVHWEFTN
jgi:hypothetical protein